MSAKREIDPERAWRLRHGSLHRLTYREIGKILAIGCRRRVDFGAGAVARAVKAHERARKALPPS